MTGNHLGFELNVSALMGFAALLATIASKSFTVMTFSQGNWLTIQLGRDKLSSLKGLHKCTFVKQSKIIIRQKNH